MALKINCVPTIKAIRTGVIGSVMNGKGMTPEELYLSIVTKELDMMSGDVQTEFSNILKDGFDSNLGTLFMDISKTAEDAASIMSKRNPQFSLDLPTTVEDKLSVWNSVAKQVVDKYKPIPGNSTSSSVVEDESDLTSDGEVTTDYKDFIDDIPEEARVIKPINASSISELVEHYLVGNMRDKPDEIKNYFTDIVSRAWMSTAVDGDFGYGFSADSNDIKNQIKSGLYQTIANYYTSNSYATMSIVDNTGTLSSDPNGVLLFDDVQKIPASKLIHEDGDTQFFTNVGIKGTDGLPLLLVVGDFVTEEDVQNFLDTDEDSYNTVVSGSYYESLDNGLPKLDRQTVQEHYHTPEVVNTYFATMMLNELDTFVREYFPMLDSTYKEKRRIGSVEIDTFGSNMSNKLTKLNIATTPILYESSAVSDVIKSVKGLSTKAVNENKTLPESLLSSNILRDIDSQENKLARFNYAGTDMIGITLNAGSKSLFVVNDGSKWRVPEFYDGKVLFHDRVSDFKSVDDINGRYNTLAVSSLFLLNNHINDADSLNELKMIAKTTDISEIDATTIIAKQNIPQTGNELPSLRTVPGHRKYMNEAELEIASEIFQDIPDTLDEARDFLAAEMINPNSNYKDLARSIYYRFFHDGEYVINDINPKNGRVEGTKHKSLRLHAQESGNTEALNAVIAFNQMLRSSALDNKATMRDGRMSVSKTQAGVTVYGLMENIDTDGTIFMNGSRITNPKVYDQFKVVEKGDGELQINFYQFGRKDLPDISFKIKDRGLSNSTVKGYKYSIITDTENPLSFDDLLVMSSAVGLPKTLTNTHFFDELREQVVTTGTGSVQTLFANLIALKLANGESTTSDQRFSEANAQLLKFVPGKGKTDIKYPFELNAFEYIDALSGAIERVAGSSVRAYTISPSGKELSATVTTTKGKSKESIIKNVKDSLSSVDDTQNHDYLYKYSTVLDNELNVLNNGVAKNGIQVDREGKDNGSLDPLEQIVYLMEGAFLQTAEKNNFEKTYFQEGTMSDRSRVDMYQVGMKTDVEFLPIKDGALDETLLRNNFFEVQRKSHKGLTESAILKWKSFLGDIVNGTTILNNIESTNAIKESIGKLDSIKTLEDLNNFIKELKLDYNDVAHKSNLTTNIFLSKDSSGNASLKHSMVMMDNLVNGKYPGLEDLFLDTYISMFNRYLEDVGYKMSKDAHTIIKNRFGKSTTLAEARDILTKSFFYHDSIASQELIQFSSGSLYQYKSKVDSLFEGIDNETNTDILKKLSKITTKEGESIQKASYKKLSTMGAEGNRLGFIKSILNSSLDSKSKVDILRFDDIFSQITPMYIDRVKRNQGIGTSFQHYIFSKEDQPGMLMDRETAQILIDDPDLKLRLLGTGAATQDIYDAVQMTIPINLYKANKSLGDKFSNYRSKGIVKSVNVSNHHSGEAIYEKKAEFPMFNPEFLLIGSVEHNNLLRKMLTAMPYSEVNGYDGIWLDEDVTNPSTEFSNNISLEEVQKHGEYLGNLLVDGKIMSSTKLLKSGIIPTSIKTNKVKNTNINNLYDLLDYYGGAETEHKIRKKLGDRFMNEEFPYGWGWYQIGEIISNYKGADGNYPLRNKYIGKVGFTSQAKTGNRKVNPNTVLTAPEAAEYSMVPNDLSGSVLMAEHNPDTTAEYNMDEEASNNMVSMITQIISASIAQGESFDVADSMYEAIGKLSDVQLTLVADRLDNYKAEERDIVKGVRRYALELAQESIKSMSDPGATRALLGLGSERLDKIAFDMKQILPLVRRSLNSHLNKQTVRFKMKGGQYIVAPSHAQIKTYEYKGLTGLFRNSISGNDINSLIKRDIENVEGLPTMWTLKSLDNTRGILEDHAPMDFIYNNKVAIRVKDFVKSDDYEKFLNGELDIKSPWLNERSSKGEELKWLNYYKDGVSIQKTDEYLSYFMAGKAPIDLAKIKQKSKDEEEYQSAIAKYFKDETNGIPKLLWARYNHRSKSDKLSGFNVLGKHQIENAYKKLSEKDLIPLANYIIKRGKKNPQQYTKEFKFQLKSLLAEDGWMAKEAEFYMPPTHQAAYMIKDGDSLQDILGTNEQPENHLLRNILTEDEIDLLDKSFLNNTPEVLAIKKKIEGHKYLRLKELQVSAMRSYFEKAIDEREKVSKLRDLTTTQKQGLIKTSPLFLLYNVRHNQIKLGNEVNKLLSNPIVLSNSSAVESLLKIQKVIELDGDTKSIVDQEISDFKKNWATSMANSFPKSLTFITARIPAQGKQSYTAGKIKNFIYSSRNAIYGPLEMLTITGADYDIDKQNNISWDVDSNGNIIEWSDYVNKTSGRIDLDEFNDTLNKKAEVFKKQLEELNVPNIDEKVLKFREAKMNHLSRAIQNFILDKLIKISKDPKNAVEAATAVSMRKLGHIKEFLDSFNFEGLESKYGLDIDENGKIIPNESLITGIQKRQHALPFSVETKALYERVNMEGKAGVGIYASALKAYLATYYAWLKNDSVQNTTTNILGLSINSILEGSDEVLRSTTTDKSDEEAFIKFNNPNAKELRATKVLDIDDDALHLIWKDPNTGLFRFKNDVYTLANTGKHMPSVGKVPTKLKSERAKAVLTALTFASDSAEEFQILSKYIDDVKLLSNFDTEDQAWEDLSELLSAATDNAKELILGKIGSNGHTSSIIASMVSLGIDLEAALIVINHKSVKDAIKTIDSDRRLVGESTDQFNKLTTLLENYNYIPEVSDEELETAIRENSGKNITESYVKEQLKIQKALRDNYNPAKQIAWYSKMAEELTKLSRVLSVNQGLPNSEFDVLKYILSVEDAIGAKLEDFVGRPEQSENEILSVRNDIIKKFNSTKVAFNIPYIISKNEHYFSYLKALVESNKILSDTSFTVRLIYKDLATKLSESGRKIKDYEFNDYINTLASIAIDNFYKQSPNSLVDIEGLYDLSNPRIKNDVKGREEFIREFPDILERVISKTPELQDNQLIQRLVKGDTKRDDVTKDVLKILTSINTKSATQSTIETYKLFLDSIRRHSPDLYDALFNYSLIIHKAGLGKGSLTSLFPATKWEEFEKSLNTMEREKVVDKLVMGLDDSIKTLIVPITAKRYSTKSGVSNFDSKGNISDEEIEENASRQQEVEDSQYNEDELQPQSRDYKAETARYYDVTDMNAARINGGINTPDVWVSRTNGLTYGWNPELGLYIPLTRVAVNAGVGYEVSVDMKGLSESTLNSLGFAWGFRMNFPDGSQGRILAMANNNRVAEDYHVIDSEGVYRLMDRDSILEFNPQLSLNYDAIKVKPGRFVPKEPLRFYQTEDGELTTVPNTSTSAVTVEAGKYKILRAADSALLNSAIIDRIKTTAENRIVTNVDYKSMKQLYPELLKEMEISLVMGLENVSDFEAEQLLLDTKVNPKVYVLRSKFDRLSESSKYRLLRRPNKERLKFIQSTTALDDSTTLVWPSVKGSDISRIPSGILSSDIEFVTNAGLVSQLRVSEFLPLIAKLGVTPDKYRQLLNMDLLVNGVDVYTNKDAIKKVDSTNIKESRFPIVESREIVKDLSPKVVAKMGAFVRSRFKNSDVRVLTQNDIVALYGEGLKDAAAFVDNGTIILNQNSASLHYKMHEMGHLYLGEIKDTDIQLYTRLMEHMDQRPEAIDIVKRLYPELTNMDDIREEAFVEYLAKVNDEKIENQFSLELEGDDGGFLGKVTNFFKSLFNGFFGKSLPKEMDISLNDSFLTIFDKIGDDILFNKNSMLNRFSSHQKNNLKRVLPSYKMSTKEAVNYLKEKGFIKWVC